jgi:hypothetical protein
MATHLDPFEDGSLLERWTFEDGVGTPTLDSLTTPSNTFIPSGAYILYDNTSPNGIDVLDVAPLESATTTLPIQLSDSVGATFCAWIKCDSASGNSTKVSLGEAGQRYNIELISYAISGSIRTQLYVHKVASQLNLDLAVSSGWHHLCAVYDSVTENTLGYLDGVYKGSIPLKISFNNRNGVSVTRGDFTTTGASGVADVAYFNRKLTLAEINSFMTLAYNYTPITVAISSSQTLTTTLYDFEILPKHAEFLADLQTANITLFAAQAYLPLSVNIDIQELLISPQQHSFLVSSYIDILSVFDLATTINQQTTIGEILLFEGSGDGVVVDNGIYVGITTLHITANQVENTRRNSFVYPPSLAVNILHNTLPRSEIINCDILEMKLAIGYMIAQPDKRKRVIKIGSVNLPTPLLWSIGRFVDNFIALSTKSVDGSSILSVLPKGKFSKEVEIRSEENTFLEQETIDAIISEISENEIDIHFTDNGIETVKFDLLGNAFSIEPIFEGSNYYYITVRVLL